MVSEREPTTTFGLPRVHLASRSPRRRELLAQIGVEYIVIDVEVDERRRASEGPADYVSRLAREKARAGAARLDDGSALVLGADTTVVLDDVALGKPGDADDARAMLARLSGRMHRVLTAVALAGRGEAATLSESRVWFRTIEPREADAYVASGEPMDKAGGYAIQGLGAVFVRHLEGSYSGVMGLPLAEVYGLLTAHVEHRR